MGGPKLQILEDKKTAQFEALSLPLASIFSSSLSSTCSVPLLQLLLCLFSFDSELKAEACYVFEALDVEQQKEMSILSISSSSSSAVGFCNSHKHTPPNVSSSLICPSFLSPLPLSYPTNHRHKKKRAIGVMATRLTVLGFRVRTQRLFFDGLFKEGTSIAKGFQGFNLLLQVNYVISQLNAMLMLYPS